MEHCNIKLFLLLLGPVCLYLDAQLVTCVIFLLCTREMLFSLDKAMAGPCSPQGPHWKQKGCVGGGVESQEVG